MPIYVIKTKTKTVQSGDKLFIITTQKNYLS